jgi:hypothetical protein
MLFNRNKYTEHRSINPQNKQGKYILEMLKQNVKVKEPLFQNLIEKKFKETQLLNLSELSNYPQQYFNETQLLEKVCIYI